MAPAAESGPSDTAKNADRGTLGKYVKRMSSVFKREKSSKSLAPLAPVAVSAQQVEQQQPTEEEGTKQEDTNEVAPAAPIAPMVATSSAPTAKDVDRNAMQLERARTLFAKYGLTLESHEWIAAPAFKPTVERVERSIRMRVHRSCHRCGTLYGAAKTCTQCEHERCKKCPRYPKKKMPEEKQLEKDNPNILKRKKVLTIRTKAGNVLAYQPPKQRVRRTCHKCETVFVPPTAIICEQCRHIRCTKCPREPAKFTKWPEGYPGDAEPDSDEEVEKQLEKFRRTWRKPRARVRWECEKCHCLFLNGQPECPGCGHERCDICTRSPIAKAKNEEQFDPDIVAAVEAKLRTLNTEGLSTGPEAT
ncbi:hypothetical protein EJ02DRAFT_384148 [Clathrospora elynae]|uniref:Uncharacterized protein n=1 Tax=Clathrospora elynae TaxID=706981 RepID=A0A6A5SI94_9PLEO|nr:hypothetical protein EJ02DRAFT_384148 [Clathrospora elynae]